MNHTEITAEVVADAERMMAEGVSRATIANRLGITRHIVGLLWRTRDLRRVGKPIVRGPRRTCNMQKGIDAGTVRLIQRMLEVNILPHGAIAREAGVSSNTVSDIATGKRLAISKWRPYLEPGERFLPNSTRCKICRLKISVVPCRVCSAHRAGNLQESV